ncbi:MAG TPA: GNAT family N-acetyltransferase [Vicinamibacterales bacterium]|nr:GNAT family N-acetyltransferase [Vicinamibacterales bacterium]
MPVDVALSTVTHRAEIERFVCEREGRRAGFLSYTLERRKTFVIDCVEVVPEYRQNGVVLELMHAALTWARAHGLIVVGI